MKKETKKKLAVRIVQFLPLNGKTGPTFYLNEDIKEIILEGPQVTLIYSDGTKTVHYGIPYMADWEFKRQKNGNT